jgi:hypothetical protein
MKDLNLQYLALEIARIDVFIRKLVHVWELAGQDSLDHFRGLSITRGEAESLSEQPMGTNWGTFVQLSPDELAVYNRDYKSLVDQMDKMVSTGFKPRLLELAETLHLSSFEYNAFLICLAPSLDLRYERIFGYLQDDVTRKLPSASLILNVLSPIVSDPLSYLDYFNEDALLFKTGLIHHPESDSQHVSQILKKDLVVAPEIVSWLLGTYRPADVMADHVSFIQSVDQPASPFVSEEISSYSPEILQNVHPLLAFYGPDEQLRTASAQYVAAKLSQPLLRVDLAGLKTSQQLTLDNIRYCLRDAMLTHAIPYFSGWDSILNEEHVAQAVFLDEIFSFSGIAIAGSTVDWSIPNERLEEEKPVFRWMFAHPSSAQRLQIWGYYLNGETAVGESELQTVADQFVLTSEQIHNAVRSAKSYSLQQNRPIILTDLFEAARAHSSHQLDQLAVKIQPRYGWKDIVLPEDDMSVLREIASTVRDRTLVLEKWGLGKKLVASAGISALFAGEPGTGKTLAAQVIASELGMDLYKVDLSTVVSKYIGDTEKNLEQIFSQAKNSNAILFFDEADAIFGKRSEVKDAHDRYANIEVGYLLQRMESYDGIVILATNLRSNMDEAFTRRLQFVIDFPFPDEAQRLEIWKVLFPPGVPKEEDINFQYMADHFKLAGGSIRNIIVSASFLAASEGTAVTTRHLLHGVRRELKKMGRLIDEKDLLIV